MVSCCGSVVEHSLGKGEVESSILSSSTISPFLIISVVSRKIKIKEESREMPTRNVNLTEYHDTFVAQLLESGRFRNASEVIRAGLRLLESQDREEQAKVEALRTAFKEGQDAYGRGAFVVMESDEDIGRYFDRVDEEIDRAVL